MKSARNHRRRDPVALGNREDKTRQAEEFVGLEKSGELPEWPGTASDFRAPKYRLLNEGGHRTFAIVLEKGAEVVDSLRQFAREHQLLGSHFTAIGAFSEAVVGFFDPVEKRYRETPIREQVEALSLIGDITVEGVAHRIHAHVVLGKTDGTAYGGHLIRAHVFPTLELILVETPRYLERRFDPETGLALIDLDRTA
ncbi:MAG TPA: PPC domain-containing DNA-binding protein [Terriglobia bacterium]|nr:PPC domain-containing DNA-binding protein [Terriglobia bacterium]